MEIVDILNRKIDVECLGCAIGSGEYVPPFGLVAQTKYFCANQDCEIPIPGFYIISTKRHIHSIDEFTEEEQADFIDLLVKIRTGMREVLDIEQVNIINVELPGRIDDHFHIWLFPATKETTEKFGTGIKAVKPAMLYAEENLKTPQNIKKVEEYAEKLRRYLVQ